MPNQNKLAIRLFQGRFKFLLVDADEYLKYLSRYIHLNPVWTKMVESATDYPWSSYAFLIGKLNAPEWLPGGRLLSQFGKNIREAMMCLSGKERGQHFGNVSGVAIAMRCKAMSRKCKGRKGSNSGSSGWRGK